MQWGEQGGGGRGTLGAALDQVDHSGRDRGHVGDQQHSHRHDHQERERFPVEQRQRFPEA